MKNFPHQFNQFTKLRAALETAQVLGLGVGDDATFGYEMARRGVYEFRGLTTSIEDRITAERAKPPSNQGARTAARDTRRLLLDLGFISGGPSWTITPPGDELLRAPTPAASAEMWRRALAQLTITDITGHTSHPTCILLRLLRDVGPLPKHVLALALEPEDDSEREYARVVGLVGLDAETRRATLGISRYRDDDAVKILPSLTLQAGLTEQVGDLFGITPIGRTVLAEGCGETPRHPEGDPPVEAPRSHRGRGSGEPERRRTIRHFRERGGAPGGTAAMDTATFDALSPEEQAAAAALRLERTRRHDDAVTLLVRLNESAGGCRRHEDLLSFDLLVEPDDPAAPLVLVEVKTLEFDALIQVRRAIGQLLTYQHLDVEPNWPGRDVVRVAVFDAPIADDYAEMLERFDIGVALVDDKGFEPMNATAQGVAGRFGA